jgi:biotin carboxyl carrier protein
MELSVNVDLGSLTLTNFNEVTGHRFRMTKDQKARAITREAALAEFVATERTARTATPKAATPRPTPVVTATGTPAVNATVPGNNS